MPPSDDRKLTAHEAARIMYNTDSPTPEQVGQVRLRIVKGRIQPSPGSHSTTTDQAVAAFMARAAVARHSAHPANENDQLSGFYLQLFQDYFLAVVARRKVGHRSGLFQRAVLIGQVVGLLLMAASVGWIIVQALHPELPERAAVRRWVQQHYGSVTFHQWFATDSPDEVDGMRVRVQFSYRSPSRRFIRTDRAFLVQGNDVRPLGSDDD